MKIWIQIRDRDEDAEFPDGATHEILDGGVLKVVSGKDIHLYSPSYWQEVTIDTRAAAERDDHAEPPDDDLKWQ